MFKVLKHYAGIALIVVAIVSAPSFFEPSGVVVFATNVPLISKPPLSDDELYLYKLIMSYRHENGLGSIPVSSSLSYVARAHVHDLEMHPTSGSLHSWSGYGPWTAFSFHGSESSEHMWRKPAELTAYKGRGYEIAVKTFEKIDPATALSLWIDSSHHNPVIINTGDWESLHWNAVGIAMSGKYAVVWFGEEPDSSTKTIYKAR